MVSAADHRGTAAHAASEILEDEATGDIQGIYEDIRQALRVAFVPDIFLALATEPDYIRLAWRQLHTNAQTVYFERSADQLRAFAVQRVSPIATGPSSPGDDVTTLVQTYNYLMPKLLIAVTALRVATTGQRPRLADIPADQKRQIATGVPKEMRRPDVISVADATPEVQTIFDDIRNTLHSRSVSTEFRMLGTSPQYLAGAWNTFKTIYAGPENIRLQREVKLMAEEIVLGFPFRMELSPHTLRHCGLTEAGIDKVRAILDRFHALVPLLTLGTAALAAGAVGPERASISAFPAEVQ